MEEDILNYSPTVMFRGTPCRSYETTMHFTVRTGKPRNRKTTFKQQLSVTRQIRW